MLRQHLSSLARRSWVRKAGMSMPGVRELAWRFVAGEGLEAAIAATRTLNARGIVATLSNVGTHVREEAVAIAAAEAAVDALRRIAAERVEANVSVKPTQLGLDVDAELCRRELSRVLDAARQCLSFVWIDMEESAYTERILVLFEELRRTYGDLVGVTLQSYLHRNRGDLARLAACGARIRLTKGGYWETGPAVLHRKADIDEAFGRDLEFLLERGSYPALATHDEDAIERARRAAERAGPARGGFEFQMLYGVRSDLQELLAHEGYAVRAYVPYGDEWWEYLLGCLRRVPGGVARRWVTKLRA